jgi:hypothetical protein
MGAADAKFVFIANTIKANKDICRFMILLSVVNM